MPEPPPPADPLGACRFETIGQGSGTGPEYQFTVKAAIGAAQVAPKGSKAAVVRVVTTSLPRVACCYRAQLAKSELQKVGKAGTVTTELTIDAAGKVTAAKADGVDGDVSACVGALIETLEFKAGKAELTATIPFVYTLTAR